MSTDTHRSKAAPGGPNNLEEADYLVLRLADGSELWTSCSALKRNGFKPSAVAKLIERKFKLANHKRADLGGAMWALSVLATPCGAIIHEAGHG